MKAFARASLLKLAVAVATGTAVLTGGLAHPATAHTGIHSITLDGKLHIVDVDWPDPDDVGDVALSSTEITSTGVFSPLDGSNCLDEVVGTWKLTFQESTESPGWVKVNAHMRLLEGASCNTTDLDGEIWRSFWLPPNKTTTKTYRVTNSDEGDDYIDFTFVISHHIWG